ncbi:MAG: transglutaminase domain-containing protein [Cyclobacteriaceae bacterium]|nr:transglutaminase domain-containing protein [Cyclobacteriaceae bacterium]
MKNLPNHIFNLALLLIFGTACNIMPSRNITSLRFEQELSGNQYPFVYQNEENSPRLSELRKSYNLDELVAGKESDLEKVLSLLAWTNAQWSHSGSNTPSDNSTFTILEEARSGKKFRCVEYGIVLRSVLAAYGYPARTLGLKTRDVETTRIGAGHVLTEVWMPQFEKWVILDAQFNTMPLLGGVPLNAVEFQAAIIEKQSFVLINSQGTVSSKTRKKYLNFIPHYLYYFDFRMDQREIPYAESKKYQDKGILQLVPLGANEPKVFQRSRDISKDLHYTHSLADFYQKPIMP